MNQPTMNTGNNYVPKTEISAAYSWPVIIIALIFFFPLGIFLICKRLCVNKLKQAENSKVITIIALVLWGIGIIYLILGFTNNLDTSDGSNSAFGMVVMSLLFIGGGFVLLFVSVRMKNTGGRYNNYIDLIINKGYHSLDYISSVVGVSYIIVEKDLQSMIACGYFAGAYINDTNREIVLWNQNASQRQYQSKVVICPGCGARNSVLVGQVSKCQYCETPIQ